MNRNDRKPPFLESECKVMLQKTLERFEHNNRVIAETYKQMSSDGLVYHSLRGLYEECVSLMIQVKQYQRWCEWYNGH